MSALAVWVMPDAPVVALMLLLGAGVAFMSVVAFIPVLVLLGVVLLCVAGGRVLDGVFALISGVAGGAAGVAVLVAPGVVAADGAGVVC